MRFSAIEALTPTKPRRGGSMAFIGALLFSGMVSQSSILATAQSEKENENFNLDYIGAYEDLDIPNALETLGYERTNSFMLMDWSTDEKAILVSNPDRDNVVTSLLVLNPFESNEMLLDYTFSTQDVLKSTGYANARHQLIQARFAPHNTDVVYLAIRYMFSLPEPEGSINVDDSMDIFRFNQTDRTASIVHATNTINYTGLGIWFDFTSDPNKLVVSDDTGIWLLDFDGNSKKMLTLSHEQYRPQDVSDDGSKLLALEYPNELVVFDLTTDIITHQFTAYTGQSNDRHRVASASWAPDNYIMYSAGFENSEPTAPFDPVILAVQNIEESEQVSYQLIRHPFVLRNAIVNSDGTSLLVQGRGYGQHDVFKLDVVRAIPEFESYVLLIVVTGVLGGVILSGRHIFKSDSLQHKLSMWQN
jgi:hypothetical protein